MLGLRLLRPARNGTTNNAGAPVQVSGLANVTRISANGFNACVLL
jgi:hypothetical protein